MATLTGTLNTTGASSTVSMGTTFDVSIDFDGIGSVALERSFDAGTTWYVMFNFTRSREMTGTAAQTALYRLNVSEIRNGDIKFRLSDGA